MKKIGIIGAMELEVEALKKEMTVSNVEKKAGMEFFEGTLNGAPVVIVRSGVGKVNAALCTQILADIFQVTHIINTGVAGSLNAALYIGDILISSIKSSDYPVVQSITLLMVALFVIINLIVDIVYALIDPRIRLE